jgi:hypothetical protein
MARWLSNFLVGLALALTGSAVIAEEDPFGPPPPLPPENAGPVLPVIPTMMTPTATVPPVTLPRRVTVPQPPTAAQKRVQERAAEAALQRKTRMQQRKHAPMTFTSVTFPMTGPLSHPSLYQYDRGIAIAFRPIVLSGLDPLPNLRPMRSQTQKRPVAPITTSGKPPIEQPVPSESIMSTTPTTSR